MALLNEYALTPDVFDLSYYTGDEACALHLQILRDVLLQEGLVRDLRNGAWGKGFASPNRNWHHRGKELLKKLATQRRLVAAGSALPNDPENDTEWCVEALASHSTQQLNGIIATEKIADLFATDPIVSAVSRLSNATWWSGRAPSVRLARTRAAYEAVLDPVWRHANSIVLIDPFIDPTDRYQYGDLLLLLEKLQHRAVKPAIEIHRASWYSGGNDKRPRVTDVSDALTPALSAVARKANISIEVFLWDEMHDRYLISDLIGISLPNGFSTTTAPNAVTTWTRLGRADRDSIQRDFDPNYRPPRHRFRVS